jgi:hypothetical protein
VTELRYEMLPHVFAYLDLASGSMIVQAAIAGIVVVPVLMRNKIRSLLGRNKPTDDIALAAETDGTAADVASDVAAPDASGRDPR